MNECSACGKVYQHRDALHKHQRQKHNINFQTKYSNVQCYHCNKLFCNKTKLIFHIKSDHNKCKNVQKRLKCSITDCETCFANYSTLRKHLLEDHKCAIQRENLEFENMNKFDEWKLKIEDQQQAMYVRDTAEKQLKNMRRLYYICHRSYLPRQVEKYKRASKACGSNKLGRACPSIIIVTRYEEKVTVVFYSTHIGHSCEIGRMKLNVVDRNLIAGKLIEGVTIQRVLTDVRDSATKKNLNRIHLLEKKDIHNIRRDFSIGYSTKRHENDAVSVKLWVQEMKLQGDKNPVLFYKEQGQEHKDFNNNDFFLAIMTEFQAHQLKKFGNQKICIDGTHGLNHYDFQLFTVMTVDEYGSGVPVVFCFSNKADTDVFKFLFECIKNRVGTIKTSVFMSDDAPAFYNAWSEVMGTVPNQLLCSWHVIRNWSQNLNKITCPEKRNMVTKTLKILQTEINQENFVLGLETFLRDLYNDEDTYSFWEYFSKYYSNRSEKWAYCFRRHLGINTNMYLESLHKTTKHHYLEGKQCKRLDKSINALMNLLQDKMFEKMIKFCKGKSSSRINKIKQSHSRSKSIPTSTLHFLPDTSEWLVSSSKDASHMYVIQKETKNCPEYDCTLKCKECNICIHSYRCSCIDNVIHYNICKHIHACVQHKLPYAQPLLTAEVNHAQNDLEEINEFITNQSDFSDNKEVQSKLEMILGLIERVNLSSDKRANVVKHLDTIINIVNQENVAFAGTSNVNVKKRIELQNRFFSTRKKTIARRDANVKPSEIEAMTLRKSLAKPSDKILNIHSGFDHTYTKKNA